jgi:hypothetical protein
MYISFVEVLNDMPIIGKCPSATKTFWSIDNALKQWKMVNKWWGDSSGSLRCQCPWTISRQEIIILHNSEEFHERGYGLVVWHLLSIERSSFLLSGEGSGFDSQFLHILAPICWWMIFCTSLEDSSNKRWLSCTQSFLSTTMRASNGKGLRSRHLPASWSSTGRRTTAQSKAICIFVGRM